MLKSILVLVMFVTLGVSLTSCAPAVKKKDKETAELEQLISRYPEVSFEELRKMISLKTAVIIDANALETYEKGHIPRALNFSKIASDFKANLPKDKDAQIVAYCGGPQCLAWLGAAQAMRKLGYINIKHFKGGLKGWKEAGGELVK